MPTLIDTHAHLDDNRFATDLPAVLQRAAAAGVEAILTIGVDLATSRAAVALAQTYPQLAAVVGIQPNHVAEAAASDWNDLISLAETRGRIVAIGESGLDRYWDRAPFPLQEDYFDRHLELARRLQLPIVIHSRECDGDLVRMLTAEFDRHGPISGVLHSFTGSAETAQACLALGLHVSFAGMITYKTAESLRQVAASVPLDRLLVETDSPYLAPSPVRGQRNEPAHVAHTADCLARVRGIPLEMLAAATTKNARFLFGLT